MIIFHILTSPENVIVARKNDYAIIMTVDVVTTHKKKKQKRNSCYHKLTFRKRKQLLVLLCNLFSII